MARNKKKLSLVDLENHVIDWWVDYVHSERLIVNDIFTDKSIPQDERDFIFAGIAQNLLQLQSLVEPLPHEEIDLQEWINDFVKDYQDADYNPRYEN